MIFGSEKGIFEKILNFEEILKSLFLYEKRL